MSVLNGITFGGSPTFNEWSADADPTRDYAYFDLTDGSAHRQGVQITSATQIPTGATINSVIGNYTMVAANLSVSFVTVGLFARSGSDNGSETNANVFNDDPDNFAGYSGAVAGPAGSWTVTKLNSAYLCVVNGTAGDDGSGNHRVRWLIADNGINYLTADVNFTLPAPSATTNAASSVTPTSAQLNGTLNPNGANATYPVSYYFQWGLDTSYGHNTTTIPGQTGSSPIAVLDTQTALTPSTTYHFRLVATNVDQTIYGADQSFTTLGTDKVIFYI